MISIGIHGLFVCVSKYFCNFNMEMFVLLHHQNLYIPFFSSNNKRHIPVIGIGISIRNIDIDQ
jgi:hypothetical protein